MLNTRRLLIVVGIFLCAVAITGCEPVEPTVGQIWLVDETYSPADAAVQARMNEIVPKVQFNGTKFKEVIQFLRETGKVNIHVKWPALEAVGIDRNTPVTLHLTRVTLKKSLRATLDNACYMNPFDYFIDNGVITISSCDDLSRYRVTRIYDVNDLIDRPKPALPDKALLVKIIRDAIHQPIEKDDSVTLAEAYQERIEELAEEIMDEFPCRQVYIADLMDLIRSTVDPNVWQPNGMGSMREFDGKLIITQTHKNHRSIERLLSAMRGKTPVISGNALPMEPTKPRIIPPSPEEILARTPVTVPPEKWPAGDKKAIVESVKILGLNTSRIYVVFLLDCTGSMLDSLGNAVDKQIIPALKNLSSEQYFNVICFHDKSTLDPFGGKLVRATADNKKKATIFLQEGIHPEGQTSFLPALAKAYSAMDVANGSDSQVIFLLTDGEFPHSAKVLDVVARRNKHMKIPIHTYDYHASDKSVKILKRLSEITDGKYKAISLE